MDFEDNQSTKWGDFLTVDGMNDEEFFYETAQSMKLALTNRAILNSEPDTGLFRSMKDFYERAKNCNDNEKFEEKVEQKVKQNAIEWKPKTEINRKISKSVPSFNPKK